MRKLLFGLVYLAVASAAQAQPNTAGPCPSVTTLSVNPQWMCIEAPTTHTVTDPLASNYIDRYDLLFFAPGVDTATGSPVQTINIGKPALNVANVMWIQRAELGAIPVGQQYRARVVAVGLSASSGRSPESNPFGRSGTSTPTAPGRVVLP